MKKILFITILVLSFFSIDNSFASNQTAPEINCYGLPGCSDTNISNPGLPGNVSKNFNGFEFLGNLISEGIKYVGAIAVIAVMISGVMYMISMGEEEKAKKAKTWIIWSLVGVVLSISAWSIINILNLIKIN